MQEIRQSSSASSVSNLNVPEPIFLHLFFSLQSFTSDKIGDTGFVSGSSCSNFDDYHYFMLSFYDICFESLRKNFKEKVLQWGKQMRPGWVALLIDFYFVHFFNSLLPGSPPKNKWAHLQFCPLYSVRCQRVISETGDM